MQVGTSSRRNQNRLDLNQYSDGNSPTECCFALEGCLNESRVSHYLADRILEYRTRDMMAITIAWTEAASQRATGRPYVNSGGASE